MKLSVEDLKHLIKEEIKNLSEVDGPAAQALKKIEAGASAEGAAGPGVPGRDVRAPVEDDLGQDEEAANKWKLAVREKANELGSDLDARERGIVLKVFTTLLKAGATGNLKKGQIIQRLEKALEAVQKA